MEPHRQPAVFALPARVRFVPVAAGRFEEAERVFDRILRLNPSDNQGVRFLIEKVRAKTAWEDNEEA
jgi:hypothetical protein